MLVIRIEGKVPYMKSDDEQIGEDWRGKAYSFFSHVACESYPCHDTEDKENFNCLFCYCPLYVLGDGCGGSFEYLPSGVKDCTPCMLPHIRENYGYITGRFQDIVRIIGR